ncbi:histidine phosphatase family protein [Bacillus sp. CGMCC 1.16607]|uniref:histidine phosphatase family protein n=1 Tax=Bacillus sp. CGMCC 1.16607 TaxID=3351842 RepID=UPI0036418145
MTKTIYLVRHCQAEGQSFSANLTNIGYEQAERLADFLIDKNIEALRSSPYLRAIHSVKPLAEKLNLQIEEDSRLSERVLCSDDRPDWMQMLEDSFNDLDLCYEGGESSRTAMARGISVITEVFECVEKTTVLATHGNLMALIIRHYDQSFGFEQWKALSNPDVYCIKFDGQTRQIDRIWGV